MMNEEDVLGPGFLEADSARYFLGSGSSSALNRSISMPLYASQLGVDANPWDTEGHLETVHHDTSNHNAVDDDVLGAGITAASVLIGVDLPDIYDVAYMRARPVGERVSLESLEKIISLAELSPREVQEIMNMVVPAGALYVTHNEFNTALALVACAQKNMDVSLETVYHHRNDLPVPVLLNLEQLDVRKMSTEPKTLVTQVKDHVVDDPWSSAIPNGITVTSADDGLSDTTGSKVGLDGKRSAPTSLNYNKQRPKLGVNGNAALRSRSMDHSALRPDNISANTEADNDLDKSTLRGYPDSNNKRSKGPTDSYQWFLDLDLIAVTLAPEKEGFIFKHVNYIVESQQRSSKVLRRYSDFYWLWEVLLKRYPMRVIPNLPPKKISGKDDSFLEVRRRGLARFINCIVRHPTLKHDAVVEKFLTEPSEFLAWRRANTPVTEEEYARELPNVDDIVDSVPPDLDERLEKLKSRLPVLSENYQTMCTTLERIVRVNEVQSREFVRYSITLNSMSELEHDCYVSNCQSCAHVVRGYEAVARHMQRTGTILDEQTSAASAGVLESLKRHCDLLSSFKEMLERKDKLSVNQIDTLSKRIAANRAKVNQNRGVPGLESEVERLDIAIENDEAKLNYQKNRDTYFRYILASELSYIHKQQAFVSLMYQSYVHEQLKFSRQLGDNWRALQVLTSEMPVEPDEFP